jgi:hydrogenase nickel incorporation protein HypA/HybF
MHESHLVTQLISALEKEIDKSGIDKIKSIILDVGELQDITEDSINHCFQHIAENEKLKDMDIKINIIPIKVKCMDCGEESIIKKQDARCGKCNGTNIKIVAGNEFNLKSITY